MVAPAAVVRLQVAIGRALLAAPDAVIVDELAGALAALLRRTSPDLAATRVALGLARVKAMVLDAGTPSRTEAEVQLDGFEALLDESTVERTGRNTSREGRAISIARSVASSALLATVEREDPCTWAVLAASPTKRRIVAMAKAVAPRPPKS